MVDGFSNAVFFGPPLVLAVCLLALCIATPGWRSLLWILGWLVALLLVIVVAFVVGLDVGNRDCVDPSGDCDLGGLAGLVLSWYALVGALVLACLAQGVVLVRGRRLLAAG